MNDHINYDGDKKETDLYVCTKRNCFYCNIKLGDDIRRSELSQYFKKERKYCLKFIIKKCTHYQIV